MADQCAILKDWYGSTVRAEQVAAVLGVRIASGAIHRYSEFPDRWSLVKEFDISLTTVLRVKRLLAQQGFMEKDELGRYVVV